MGVIILCRPPPFEELRAHHKGKITLRTHEFKKKPHPKNEKEKLPRAGHRKKINLGYPRAIEIKLTI